MKVKCKLCGEEIELTDASEAYLLGQTATFHLITVHPEEAKEYMKAGLELLKNYFEFEA